MAFGFPASYETVITNFPAGTDIKRSAGSALSRIGWNPKFEGNTIVAKSAFSMASWGEKITVEVLPNGSLKVRSQCGVFLQCFDFGKTKKNIERFQQELPRHFVSKQEAGVALR